MNAAIAHLACCLLSTVLVAPRQGDTEKRPDAEGNPASAREAPSLDELLGLKEPDSAAQEAARQNEQELERRLTDAQIGDVLDLALDKMDHSARLLDEQDAGLGTQRVQRDILARLDELIDLAKQMSAQQQMSGGSGASGRKQKSQPKPGRQPRPASGERRDAGNQGGQANDPPPRREGELNPAIEQTESEWGTLPQRLREMLKQGSHGYTSGLYQELTNEYYKRLAEEGSS